MRLVAMTASAGHRVSISPTAGRCVQQVSEVVQDQQERIFGQGFHQAVQRQAVWGVADAQGVRHRQHDARGLTGWHEVDERSPNSRSMAASSRSAPSMASCARTAASALRADDRRIEAGGSGLGCGTGAAAYAVARAVR